MTERGDLTHNDDRRAARLVDRARPHLAALFLIVAIANGAAIVWIWLRDGGAAQLRFEPLVSFGRLAGLEAAYVALITLLLIARAQPLERFAGVHELARWHKQSARLCLGLVAVHVGLTVAGDALPNQQTFVGAFVAMTTNLRGMPAAVAGTAILFWVGATSSVIVRRRLPYETWYFVHVAAYSGVALAFLHQIADGDDLALDHPVTRAYWIATFAAVATWLVLSRVGWPLGKARRHLLRVSAVEHEAPGVVSLSFSGPSIGDINASGGQFFFWRFLAPGLWWQAHPFSLSAAPDGRRLRITVKAVGDFTEALQRIRVGTRVISHGPFGSFTPARQSYGQALLIAGGIGITAVRALVDELRQRGHPTLLLYRVRSEADIVFRRELADLANVEGVSVRYVVGRRSAHDRHDPLTAALSAVGSALSASEIYLCGPPEMMRATERTLRDRGVSQNHIHRERFALVAP